MSEIETTGRQSVEAVRAAEFVARRIARRWEEGVAAIVDCGQLLIDAKNELPHGEWTAMVEELLPFSSRTAQKLMGIARNSWIADSTHMTLLPPAWSTLYELSRLPEDALERAAAEGLLRPEMERNEAVRLRRPLAPALPPAPALGGEAAQAQRYGAILADPPWPFDTWGESGKDRSPERHYRTMSIAEICALPVAAHAAEDCALFLWAVSATAREAVQVLAAWGFEFKTVAFVWAKEGAFGNGYWSRQRCEFCLLATRGQPRRLNADVDQLITAPRGQHSEKPEEAAARIERLVGGPYLELFARRERPGWARWGNEVDKLDREDT